MEIILMADFKQTNAGKSKTFRIKYIILNFV